MRAPGGGAALHSICRQLRIQLSDPELVDGLLSFLEQMGVDVAPSGVETTVDLPDPSDGRDSRRELERYLRLWEDMHPNAGAALVD